MTLRDRILTYCSFDEEHAGHLAESLLGARGAQLLAERLATTGWECERCHRSPVEETGFCVECSHVTPRSVKRGR